MNIGLPCCWMKSFLQSFWRGAVSYGRCDLKMKVGVMGVMCSLNSHRLVVICNFTGFCCLKLSLFFFLSFFGVLLQKNTILKLILSVFFQAATIMIMEGFQASIDLLKIHKEQVYLSFILEVQQLCFEEKICLNKKCV